jgi:hypothetical protein
MNGGDLQVLGASRGIAWLMTGFALLRMQTARLLLIAVLMQVILALTQLPIIGFLVVLSVPALNAGMLEAFHVTATSGRPAVSLLIRPLTSPEHVGRLLAMGAVVFVVGVLAVSLALSGSEEMLDPELMTRIEQGDLDAVAELDQGTLGRMMLALVVGVSVSGTLSYFAVPLIWFRRLSLWQALALGMRGLLSNWKPLLVLGLGLAAVLVPVSLVVGALVALAGSGGLLGSLILGLIMMLVLAFQLVLFGTQYCAFREVFGVGPEARSPDSPADDQLLA